MTRTIAALAAAVLLLAQQAGPSLAKDDAALKAAAETYVRHPVVQKTLDDMWSVDTIRSALVVQLQAGGTKLRDDQVETLTRILHEELNRLRPRFQVLMTNAVMENYALEEIRALNGFLETEVGARAMAKSGSMMRSFNAGAGQTLRGLFERLSARMKAELPK